MEIKKSHVKFENVELREIEQNGAYHKNGFYHKKGLGMLKQNSHNVDHYADGTRSTCPNDKIYC